MKGAWIENLAWPEVGARLRDGWPVILPIGARSKEHGHHLPMQTDYLVARALCDGIAAELEVLVAPVVDFGYYPAFTGYPGSQHLRAETFVALLTDLLDGLLAGGATRLFIVNTGVSTEGPVQIATRDLLSRRGAQVGVADIRRLGRASERLMEQAMGGHADERETSVMLAIAPALVDMTRARPDYGHMLDQPASVFLRPVRFTGDATAADQYSATGARGDPSLASAEKGRAVLADMVRELVAGVRAG